MKTRRWMTTMKATAEAEMALPWSRGSRRARWKAAARARARAA